MAVALDNSSSGGQTASGLGGTFSVTINALNDTWLFLFLSYSRITSTGLAVTVAGNAATLIASAGNTTDGHRTEIWAYKPLATGAQTVSVTWTTNNHRVAYSWASYTGVDATTPYGTATTVANATGTTGIAAAITTVSGDAAIFALTASYTGTTATADTGDTTLRNASTGSLLLAYSSYQLASGTSTTVGTSTLQTARNYSYVSVAVNQVVAPTPINSSDTATATEGTPSLVGSYSQAESATATEGTPTLTGAYAETDGATATEGTPALTGAYGETDAAAASEGDPAIAADLADADTTTATEGTPGLIGDYAETDTVSATEGVPTLTAGYAATDTGTATEGESILVIPAPRAEGSQATLTLVAGRRVTTVFPIAGATVALVGAATATVAAVPSPALTLTAGTPLATVAVDAAVGATVTPG